jgi:hypothetical protein
MKHLIIQVNRNPCFSLGRDYSTSLTVNNLLCFFPRAANFLGPFFVTAPIIELIGDRGVTAANPLCILRFGCCRFDSARFWACRAKERLRQSSRSFAVAHFVPR